MDILFRLDMTSVEADNYFSIDLPAKDGYFFYATEQIRDLGKGDNIYFSCDLYVKAKAIFSGDSRLDDQERDPKYKHGYKLSHIEIIDSLAKLDSNLFKGQSPHLYIRNASQQNELERVLSNRMIYSDEIAAGDEKYVEGGKKLVLVNSYERSSEARANCLKHYGYDCQVCGFSFENFYGDVGNNYIHVHHVKPLSDIKQNYKVDSVNDLIPVCPNCHSMLHKKTPPFTIMELKALINKP